MTTAIKLGFLVLFAYVQLSSCRTTGSNTPPTKTTKENTNAVKLGNKYAKDGLYTEAIEQYKKALQSKKLREVAFRNLGIVQVKTGDYRGAVKSFDKAGRRFDKDYEFNFYSAEAYRGIKKYDRAIYHYNRADEIKPNTFKVMKPLAWSYFQIRYYSKAISISKKMLRMKPKDVQVYLIVARTLLQTNRDQMALKVVKKARRFANEVELAHLKSIEGDIYLTRKEYSNATRAYRYALKKEPLLAGALYGLGKCLIHDKQIERGIKYLERAMRVRPEHAQTYLALGDAYKNKNRNKHVNYMKQFLKLSANDPELLDEAEQVRNALKKN